MIIWCMVPEISSMTDKIFCHFGQYFAYLPPLKPEKSKIWRNEKNAWRYYHVIQEYQKSDNMLYCSWDMARDRCNSYFSFWTIFCSFTPLTPWKIKISKKWKKQLEMLSSYTSLPKIMIICYAVPEIWCMKDVIIFHFGPFFVLLPPNSPKNKN